MRHGAIPYVTKWHFAGAIIISLNKFRPLIGFYIKANFIRSGFIKMIFKNNNLLKTSHQKANFLFESQ